MPLDLTGYPLAQQMQLAAVQNQQQAQRQQEEQREGGDSGLGLNDAYDAYGKYKKGRNFYDMLSGGKGASALGGTGISPGSQFAGGNFGAFGVPAAGSASLGGLSAGSAFSAAPVATAGLPAAGSSSLAGTAGGAGGKGLLGGGKGASGGAAGGAGAGMMAAAPLALFAGGMMFALDRKNKHQKKMDAWRRERGLDTAEGRAKWDTNRLAERESNPDLTQAIGQLSGGLGQGSWTEPAGGPPVQGMIWDASSGHYRFPDQREQNDSGE